MQPNLLVISNKRYATDFRKYLIRAAIRAGSAAVHVYCWESIIISYGDRERHTFDLEHAYREIFSVIEAELGERAVIGLTGLGGYIHRFPFAVPKFMKNAQLIYDVYDDFSYAATGRARLQKIYDDMRWRIACHETMIIGGGLRRWYPRAKMLENASHCEPVDVSKDPKHFVYAGSIDRRVDFDWLRKLVSRDVCLDIYGRIHAADPKTTAELNLFLSEHRNVRYFGEYDNDNICEILSKYSVGVIPYHTSQRMTNNVYPDKIYHYLNSGLEVLAAPIPHAIRLRKFIHLIGADDDWEEVLSSLRTGSKGRDWRRDRHNWDVRWRELCSHMKKRSFI